MTNETYALLERYMHSCMGDAAHDREHVYRVLYLALDIAQTEQEVDHDVLIAAALLHDIGRAEQLADPSVCHALAGGEKAERFLLAQGFDPAFARRVRRCIETHRFRSDDPPASLEAKILFDADKLDVSGATGIARTLQYGGRTGEPLYTTGPDGAVLDGEEDAPSFFHEYQFKLKRVASGFHTARAAELARARQEIAAAFYESLRQEVCAAYDGRKELTRCLDGRTGKDPHGSCL